MATTHTISQPDSDSPSLSNLKGEIKKCHACNNAALPPPKRIYCRYCLANGYSAKCLPCNGTGSVHAIAAWDGKSKHGSTCLTCGGLGVIPARKSEFEAQEAAKGKKEGKEAKESLAPMVT